MRNKSKLKIAIIVFVISLGLNFALLTISNFNWSFKLKEKDGYIPKSSMGEITIVTPENKTYTKPMIGYYPATHGFEEEIGGTTNQDIGFIDLDSSDTGSYFEIEPNFVGHKKVLKCVDGIGYSSLNGTHYLNKTTSSGTVEFWYAIDNIAILNGMQIRFYGDGGHAWYISCYAGTFRSNGWVSMGSALANKWYHIKMEYNCSLNEVDYYIDGDYKRTASFGVPCNQ